MGLMVAESHSTGNGLKAKNMKPQAEVSEDMFDRSRRHRIPDLESNALSQYRNHVILGFGGGREFATGEFPQIGQ